MWRHTKLLLVVEGHLSTRGRIAMEEKRHPRPVFSSMACLLSPFPKVALTVKGEICWSFELWLWSTPGTERLWVALHATVVGSYFLAKPLD